MPLRLRPSIQCQTLFTYCKRGKCAIRRSGAFGRRQICDRDAVAGDTDTVKPITRDELPGLDRGGRERLHRREPLRCPRQHRIVIDNRAAGWVVFYSERGGEFDLQAHPTEDDACRDVLRRLGIKTRLSISAAPRSDSTSRGEYDVAH
jgi:hypothetical protein